MQENIHLSDSQGNKVSAILSTPNEKTVRLVIMCHGLNSGKESLTNLALEEIFLKNNIATFRFDFFAHKESDGKMEDRTVDKFVDNILKAVEYVKSRGYTEIAGYGASFGGVALSIAASKSPDIRAIALKAAGMGQTSRTLPNYKEDFDAKSWIKAGEKINIPTIVIHGTADKDVEVELGKKLAKSIKGSELKLYEDADHRFSKKEDFDRMVKDISEFLMKTF